MKALLLSLVLAFTGSFALACPLDPENITQVQGSCTPRNRAACAPSSLQSHSNTQGSVVSDGSAIK